MRLEGVFVKVKKTRSAPKVFLVFLSNGFMKICGSYIFMSQLLLVKCWYSICCTLEWDDFETKPGSNVLYVQYTKH